MKTTQILIAGFGGQGVLFAGKFLAYKGLLEDLQVSWLPSYGPEMRGGTANCSVILSEDPVGSPIITEPDVLIGGFHFMGLDPQGAGREELERAAQALAGHKAVCWTCHCTGKKPFDWLKDRLGERLHYLAGGMSIEV